MQTSRGKREEEIIRFLNFILPFISKFNGEKRIK
jgi:hypothetical protein